MSVPKHIAVILDGNRRFAKRLLKNPWEGHTYGKKKVKKLLDWCIELGITELTLYAFSMQNLNRPKKEYDFIMDVFRDALKEFFSDDNKNKDKMRLRVLGRIDLLPEDICNTLKEAQEKTKQNTPFTLNMALAYGGREEIVDAVNKMLKDNINSIDEKSFAKYLYFDSEPDLIIRTGGDRRTSNFLPWQSIYSEWAFLEKTWPEFERKDLVACIDDFNQRERRFGR